MRRALLLTISFLAADRLSAADQTSAVPPIIVEKIDIAAGAATRSLSWREVSGLLPTGVIDNQRALERRREAEGRETIARSEWLPGMGTLLNHRRIDGAVQATLGDVERAHFSGDSLAESVRFEIDPLGTRFRGSSAEHVTEMARADEERVRQTVIRTAADDYLELFRLRALVRVGEGALAESRALADLVNTRSDQGLALRADALRASALRTRREAELSSARAAYRLASIRLVALIGLDPSTIIEPSESELAGLTPAAGDALQVATEHRPDLHGASERVAALEDAKRAQIWTDRLPHLSSEYQFGTLGHHFATDQQSRQSFTLGLRWSFLDAFGRTAAAREVVADAQLRDARLALDDVRRRVAVQVFTAIQQIDEAALRNRLAREENAAAEEAQSISDVRFRNGLGLLVDQLQQLEALERSRTAVVESVVAYDRAQLDLLLATGTLDPSAVEAAFR